MRQRKNSILIGRAIGRDFQQWQRSSIDALCLVIGDRSWWVNDSVAKVWWPNETNNNHQGGEK